MNEIKINNLLSTPDLRRGGKPGHEYELGRILIILIHFIFFKYFNFYYLYIIKYFI
jgi:hypothetical protein